MSDNMRFVLIMTEGPHDVEAIAKILRLRGYSEKNNKKEIPEALQVFIPKSYPFDVDGHMERGVPRPSFLTADNKYVVIFNAGGISRIVNKLSDSLSMMRASLLQMLSGIAIVADMDISDQVSRQQELIDQIKAETEDYQVIIQEQGTVEITSKQGSYPLRFFFFPDNSAKGTLEMLLLDGAQISYPDLAGRAKEYIDCVKVDYPLRNYDELKATVGAVANVLKPGKANQVSIHDNDWFTPESLEKVYNQRCFAAFIDSVISLMEELEKHDGKNG